MWQNREERRYTTNTHTVCKCPIKTQANIRNTHTQDPTNKSCLSQVVTWIKGNRRHWGKLLCCQSSNSNTGQLQCLPWLLEASSMNCKLLTGSGDWKTERRSEQLNDSEASNLYPWLEAFTVWVGELAARQSLTTGSAESAESSNLSQPLKPGYVYSITAPQDSGGSKERRVKLGHQFRGLVCSVGTFTQRQPTGRQCSTNKSHQHTVEPPSSTVTCSVTYRTPSSCFPLVTRYHGWCCCVYMQDYNVMQTVKNIHEKGCNQTIQGPTVRLIMTQTTTDTWPKKHFWRSSTLSSPTPCFPASHPTPPHTEEQTNPSLNDHPGTVQEKPISRSALRKHRMTPYSLAW